MPTKGKTLCAQKPAVVAGTRDPLPNCLGQNVHPAKTPATHCTPQEAAAQCAERQAMEERIHEGERVKEFMVQLNINEEHYDQEVLHDNPLHLSSVLCKHGGEYVNDSDSDGEEFDFHTIEAEADLDSSALSVRPVKEKVSCFAHNLHVTD